MSKKKEPLLSFLKRMEKQEEELRLRVYDWMDSRDGGNRGIRERLNILLRKHDRD